MSNNVSANATASSRGIGFCGFLTLIFVVAKIWGKIDWSWWWVFSPLWIPTLVAVAVLILVLIGAGIADLASRRKRKNRRESLRNRGR